MDADQVPELTTALKRQGSWSEKENTGGQQTSDFAAAQDLEFVSGWYVVTVRQKPSFPSIIKISHVSFLSSGRGIPLLF